MRLSTNRVEKLETDAATQYPSAGPQAAEHDAYNFPKHVGACQLPALHGSCHRDADLHLAISISGGFLLVGVLVYRALLSGVYIRTPVFF